jgi:hypothetical protein
MREPAEGPGLGLVAEVTPERRVVKCHQGEDGRT